MRPRRADVRSAQAPVQFAHGALRMIGDHCVDRRIMNRMETAHVLGLMKTLNRLSVHYVAHLGTPRWKYATAGGAAAYPYRRIDRSKIERRRISLGLASSTST